MKFFIVLFCVWGFAQAFPQADSDTADPPPEEETTDPPDEETTDPPDEETTDPDTDKLNHSEETTDPPDTDKLNHSEETIDETTDPDTDKLQKKVTVIHGNGNDVTILCPPNDIANAKVTIDPNEEPPANAVTDIYGNPIKENDVKTYKIGDPEKTVIIEVEKWQTFQTRPPTKPNCMCLTRGPLSRFKLIGNIHFRGIKRPPKHHYTTENQMSTMCPPCNCDDCFTTESETVTKKKFVC